MATIMTKQGNLDNIITYEHFCDTIADLENIDPHYITLGSICNVIKGRNNNPEIYIANSNKEWELFSINHNENININFHICSNDEYDSITRIPIIDNPIENTFYLVPSVSLDDSNLFEEWIYVNNNWEKFGRGSTDIFEQIQADWNIDDVNSKAYIKNKPNIPNVSFKNETLTFSI